MTASLRDKDRKRERERERERERGRERGELDNFLRGEMINYLTFFTIFYVSITLRGVGVRSVLI